MKKYRLFDRDSDFVLDKNLAIRTHLEIMLAKSSKMFTYSGLPDSIPSSQLERMLQTFGSAIICKVNGKLYALQGTLGGEKDEYQRPTQYIVSNTWLNHYHEYGINGNDSGDNVLCKNDLFCMGLVPIYKKYGSLITENFITFRTLLISMRSILNMSASDDKTALSAKEYINKLENGDIGVIAENAFFDGVKTHNIGATSNSYITQFIELMQYLKASEMQEIGVNANYNMKREYIGMDENALNDDILRPFVDNMLDCRMEMCDRCNKLFGTDVKVKFSSIWETTNLENEKEKSNNNNQIVNPDKAKGSEKNVL